MKMVGQGVSQELAQQLLDQNNKALLAAQLYNKHLEQMLQAQEQFPGEQDRQAFLEGLTKATMDQNTLALTFARLCNENVVHMFTMGLVGTMGNYNQGGIDCTST